MSVPDTVFWIIYTIYVAAISLPIHPSHWNQKEKSVVINHYFTSGRSGGMQTLLTQASHPRIGSLHNPVTWNKITHAGEQVAQCDFQNNATRTSPPGPAFVWKSHCATCSPACAILPCDQIVQRAHWPFFLFEQGLFTVMCSLNRLSKGGTTRSQLSPFIPE